MRTIEDNRAVLAAVLVMVAFNGLFLSANAAFMLVAPLVWYELVPGVTDTGLFNQHFVRDIGIIQLFLGVAFIVGQLKPERRVGLWAAATLWLSAHAVFPLLGGRRRHLRALGAPPRLSRRHPAGACRHRAHPLGHPPLPHRKERLRLRPATPSHRRQP